MISLIASLMLTSPYAPLPDDKAMPPSCEIMANELIASSKYRIIHPLQFRALLQACVHRYEQESPTAV